MKTIVAATDFSDSSLNAVQYAGALASATGHTLTIVHVSQGTATGQNDPGIRSQVQQLKEKLNGITGLTVHAEILAGPVVAAIRKFCKQVDPWVVIMGAEKAGALQRFFLSGRTIEAMQVLEWPVIVVPAGVHYKTIHRVGISCDLMDVQNTFPLKQVEEIRKIFEAEIFVLNVKTVETKKAGSNTEEQAKTLMDVLDFMSPKFLFIDGASVEESIEKVAQQNRIDLLIVIPKKHGFFHRLFYDSQSTRMVLSSQVPMLSMRQ